MQLEQLNCKLLNYHKNKIKKMNQLIIVVHQCI